MLKYIPLLFLMILILACTGQPEADTVPLEAAVKAVADEEPAFIKQKLLTNPEFVWFQEGYKDYVPKQEAVDAIAKNRKRLSVIALGGRWCGDTKRILPAFYKIMDAAQVPESKIRLVEVDPQMHSADGTAEKHNVTGVPVFIVSLDGKEKGTVTYKSEKTIEEALADLLQ